MSGITVLVAFGPEHAHTIASGGLSKRDVQKFLCDDYAVKSFLVNSATASLRLRRRSSLD